MAVPQEPETDTTNKKNRLPERVQKLVLEQEIESERLIGWGQLLLASIFTALFLLAPRPVDAPIMVYQPVPLALLAYGAFTVLRLFASYRGYTPAWLLIVSIFLDVLLVIGLVWYFHIQYDQPPAFSLKVPTFVYLFAFVSLRALRFDPRYVMLSGIFAAVGWLLLVAWAVNTSPDGTITRNFTEYVNGNRILRGVEFDKVFSILTVTAALSFAIWRARQTLLRAATEISTGREMRKFLSKGVAETIAEHDTTLTAGEATERQAAIIMVDIRGFSNYSSQVTPHDIVTMLTSYHDRIVPLINSHGGIVDKFMGDGVMATFGAVTPSDTAARDALEAVENITRTAPRWQAEHKGDDIATSLQINVAAASGSVVFATLGSEDRLEYTVVGQAANLAAKLEKHNKDEGTLALVTREMWRTAQKQGYQPAVRSEKRRARKVAGVDDPVDLVALFP
ncbi:MAG: adenylate/guanylate cyclase domain-containing protein [Hyphomicrobiaceae bacterium]